MCVCVCVYKTSPYRQVVHKTGTFSYSFEDKEKVNKQKKEKKQHQSSVIVVLYWEGSALENVIQIVKNDDTIFFKQQQSGGNSGTATPTSEALCACKLDANRIRHFTHKSVSQFVRILRFLVASSIHPSVSIRFLIHQIYPSIRQGSDSTPTISSTTL